MATVNGEVVQLSEFPVKFDNTALPFFPKTWGRSLAKIMNKQQSEGGTDLIQTIRTKKLSVPISCSVQDDEWVEFFERYFEKDEFTLSVYSPRVHAYEQKRVHMDNLSIQARDDSEELTAVTGTWDVSFTLEEF